MSFALECNKLKRTFLIPILLLGGILSAVFPIINLLARTDSFVNLEQPPLQILANGNWSIMTMLNLFLIILGTCYIYHIEFSDNAIQHMDSLPIKTSSLFLNKFLLLAITFAVILIIEGASFLFCTSKWFVIEDGFITDLIKFIFYSYLLSLPILSIMLAVSSVCKNMWTTVGIGVVGIFASLMLTSVESIKYFPFSMPYQSSLGDFIKVDTNLCIVAVVETIIFLIIGIILSKVRRNAQ